MSYQFFQNKDCEFFPCHAVGGKETEFNCLFCFCPLYTDVSCGGNYSLLPNGIKDCTSCLVPHFHYQYIIDKLSKNMSVEHLDLFADVDVIQVGARNMQNFELLKVLGRCDKPILLKRGLANTIEEWLMSAEYIMAGGNSNIILCERGIRTFETMTRNTLDISSVPVLKRISHLPVVVDPSHGTGVVWLVEPMAKAAIMAGADGLIIETHNNPAKALSDGAQSLNLDQFDDVMHSIKRVAQFEGKNI